MAANETEAEWRARKLAERHKAVVHAHVDAAADYEEGEAMRRPFGQKVTPHGELAPGALRQWRYNTMVSTCEDIMCLSDEGLKMAAIVLHELRILHRAGDLHYNKDVRQTLLDNLDHQEIIDREDDELLLQDEADAEALG